MWILNGMILVAIALFMQLPNAYGQSNVCNAAAIANCGPYPCIQTDTIYSCLCTNMQLAQSAAGCNNGVIQPPVVIPNTCANVVCPVGATCIATNQNPAAYVCLCANNILANPDCPTNPLPNNPCLLNNPCANGGTCSVNPLTNQAICICPPNTYGSNCSNYCPPRCASTWCYNGGRCTDSYGQSYCSCPQNFRGRRCELRYNAYNYVYLYHSPYYYLGK